MRLIDADALAKKLTDWSTGTVEPIDWSDIAEAPTIELDTEAIARRIATIFENEQDMRVILSQPTIDAVQVVRCKECKHRDPEDEKCDSGMWHFPFKTRADDFCSYGERKEGE